MEQQKAVYLGNLKPIGENGLRMRIYEHKLKDHWKTDEKGNRYVDGIVNPNKNGVDQFGYTHYMKLNEYDPSKRAPSKQVPSSDLPF